MTGTQPMSAAERDKHIAECSVHLRRAQERFMSTGSGSDCAEVLRLLHEQDWAIADRLDTHQKTFQPVA